MILFRQMPLASGDVLTAHEFNAELESLVGEMNGGIDRENITAGLLTGSRLDDMTTVYQEDSISSSSLDLGEQWTPVRDREVLGHGGRAIIDAALTLDINGNALLSFEVGILVDGKVEARTGTDSTYTGTDPFDRLTKEVRGAPVLSMGYHTVTLAVRAPAQLTYTHIMSDLHIMVRIR